MEDAERCVNTPVVIRHLMAQEAARQRMVGVALQARDTAIFYSCENAARVGAIKRARGLEDVNPFAADAWFLTQDSHDSNTGTLCHTGTMTVPPASRLVLGVLECAYTPARR